MGKMKEDPKYNVFTFRAADQDAEDIQQAAKAYESMSDFLLTAAVEKARADYARDHRARVAAKLGE